MTKRKALETVSLSEGAPMWNLEARFVYRGLRETVKESPDIETSLSMGTL